MGDCDLDTEGLIAIVDHSKNSVINEFKETAT